MIKSLISHISVLLLVSGCTNFGVHPFYRDWSDLELCASHLGETSAALSEPNTAECGIIVRGVGGTASRSGVGCAARMLEQHRPFRLANVVFGPDAGDCEIVIWRRSGAVDYFRYYYDFSFTSVQRWREAGSCARFDISRAPDGRGNYYKLDRCLENDILSDQFEALRMELRK